jgi:hypothetical protein
MPKSPFDRCGAISMQYSDLAFVIPFRRDSAARLENLDAVLRFLVANFADAEIIIIESGPHPAAGEITARHNVQHSFVETKGLFHRTRLINFCFQQMTHRPFVASFDADVLPYPAAVTSALEALREGAGATLLFNGVFLDIRGALRISMLEQPDPGRFDPAQLAGMTDVNCINRNSVGGALLFNRAKFIACGGYNENFLSWGWEDTELAERLTKMGHPLLGQDAYPLLHLSHPRGQDSDASNPYFLHNSREYRRIRKLGRSEIEDNIRDGRLKLSYIRPPTLTARAVGNIRSKMFAITRRVQ